MAEVVDHYHGIRGFIVLAHFCEQHGPSVAYSTRLIRADTSLYHFSFPASSPSATNVSAPTRPAQHKQLSMSSSLILSPSKKLMPSSSFVARSAVPPSPLSLPARDGSSSPGLLPQDPSPRGEDSTTPHHHHHHASHAAKKSRRRKESRKRASVVVDPFASVISKTPFTQSAAFLARKPDANKKSPASRKTFRKARNDRMQSYFERHSNDDGLDSDSDSERDSASGSDEEDFGLSSSSASSSDLEGSDNAAGSVDSSSEGDAPGDLFLTLLPSHVEPVASAALPPNSSSPSSSSPSPPSQDASGDTP
ncbi:MAG: hypothetical protein Q8P67_02205 [archaeon]|nr:hypothetical protein [archaeon]